MCKDESNLCGSSRNSHISSYYFEKSKTSSSVFISTKHLIVVKQGLNSGLFTMRTVFEKIDIWGLWN